MFEPGSSRSSERRFVKKIKELLHNPKVLAKFHGWMTMVWFILAVPTVIVWKESILWVALMSVWANIAGHWSAYQAARAEEEQD
jgi:hypothetical protein